MSAFDESPDALHALRELVADWLGRASEAIDTFYDSANSSFWVDSRRANDAYRSGQLDSHHPSSTATARCYMALAYVARSHVQLRESTIRTRISRLRMFAARQLFWLKEAEVVCSRDSLSESRQPLNNFELAHLADLFFCNGFADRFHSEHLEQLPSTDPALENQFDPSLLRPALRRSLLLDMLVELADVDQVIEKNTSKTGRITKAQGLWKRGALAIEKNPDSSAATPWVGNHYFVTLHWLRALAILDPANQGGPAVEWFCKTHMADVERHCIEQCFYAQRGIVHLYDPTSLIFAGVIYCLYARDVSPDICQAIVDALAGAQRENGSWPATHPIIRRNQVPWHITSHELALSLTWLYFQPRVPDSARAVVLSMMEKYFRGWVIKTLVHVPREGAADLAFKGWFDDHTTDRNFAVGWATGIVGHFLSNYYRVLSDHLNRRVVEILQLTDVAKGYLIDATARERSKRWSKHIESSRGDRRLATWPDLPPFGWSLQERKPQELAKRIVWNWTDPSIERVASTGLAVDVLAPIFKAATERPKAKIAGILPGSPGTRKTTLVKTVSEILEWPYIAVPASVIFERGFDMMETRANEVFRLLSYLTGCVIFFDEFEEFFRDRREEAAGLEPAPVHNRTIAAFTTSAMLPRLQDLHDAKRCLVFFATNHLEKVDPAIKRTGRFDFQITIEHPEQPALVKYLETGIGFKLLERLNLQVDHTTCSVVDSPERYEESKAALREIVHELLNKGDQLRFSTVEDALVDLFRDPIAVRHKDEAARDAEAGHEGSQSDLLRKRALEILKAYRQRDGDPNQAQAPPDLALRSDHQCENLTVEQEKSTKTTDKSSGESDDGRDGQ